MTTYEDLVKHGETKFSPKFYRHWRTDSQYLINTEAQPLYKKGSTPFPKYKSVGKPTLKDKQRYFIITTPSTPTGNIREYVKMAKGRVTKDLDKADYIVFDDSSFNKIDFEATYESQYTGDVNAVITSASRYNNWNQHQDLVSKQIEGRLVNSEHGYTTYYKQYSIAAAAALDKYPNKVLHPYDLGVASGSITELTEDNIKAVMKMLTSRNESDTQLANHMIGTFDYEKSLLLTWKFCRTLYVESAGWYFNRRMKSVRTFVDKYYEKYCHLDASSFFMYCKNKGTVTPEIFDDVYKVIQRNIRIMHNPGIYTVKFEMKPEYKELLKAHAHGKSMENNPD